MKMNFAAFDHIQRHHMREPPQLAAVDPKQTRPPTSEPHFFMQFPADSCFRQLAKLDRASWKAPIFGIGLAHQENTPIGIEHRAYHAERDRPEQRPRHEKQIDEETAQIPVPAEFVNRLITSFP